VGRHVEQVQRRLQSIQTELSQTQLRAAAQQARADTLEQQLTQVRQALPPPRARRGPENLRRRRALLEADGRARSAPRNVGATLPRPSVKASRRASPMPTSRGVLRGRFARFCLWWRLGLAALSG
jgi:hypothetical protein